MAISASIGVLLVMLASLTLLPALLTTFGARVARPSRRARRRAAKAQVAMSAEVPAQSAAIATSQSLPVAAATTANDGTGIVEGGMWLRWSKFVQRKPWSIAIVSTLVMLAIAAPATALRLGSSDASNDPANQTTHRAYELLAEGFGQGFNGPLLVVAKVPPSPSTQAAAQGISQASAAG